MREMLKLGFILMAMSLLCAAALGYVNGQTEERIAAQRVLPVGMARRLGQPAEIPRRPAMVEDDFLVKLSQFVQHQAKISRTILSASASASTSSIVL